ncbi:uncharacterized protein LOC105696732 [Orussus abietinus]|uniref:uncharacterized protein LOC105696732 n=1 Tax=Orussus abietinus TaxID=222816 RepID=UPI000626997E|nr:uncharacterized protein LOC105696732 [Orussus abietinus]
MELSMKEDRDSDDLIRDPPSMFANSEMFGQRILRMASDATNQGDNLPEGAYQDESEEKAVVSIVVDGRVLTPKEIKLLGLMTEDRSSVDAIFNSKASKLLSKIKDLTEKGSKSKEESVDGNYKEADRESMNESPLESVINVEI